MGGQGNDATDKVVMNEDGSVDIGKKHYDTAQEAMEKTQKQYDDMRPEFERRGNENSDLKAKVELYGPIVESLSKGEIKPDEKGEEKEDKNIEGLFVDGDAKATAANIQAYVDSEIATAVEKGVKPFKDDAEAKTEEDAKKEAKKWVTDAKAEVPELDDQDLMKKVLKRAAVTHWDDWFEQNPDLAKVCHNNPVRAAHLMLVLEEKTAKDKAKKSGFSEGGGGGGSSSETKMSEEAFRKLPAGEQAKVIEKEMNERYEKRAAEKASG